MRRAHARGPAGVRVVGTKPFANWKTISLVGAIRLGYKPKLMTHAGTVTGRVFLRFVRSRLVPWLRKGDTVVMDNLNAHKMAAVRLAIEAAGARVLFLPPYSPELNPIELWWADVKRQLRQVGVDGEAQLRRAVRRVRAGTHVRNIAAWFKHSLSFAQRKRSPR
jgi:transposase